MRAPLWRVGVVLSTRQIAALMGERLEVHWKLRRERRTTEHGCVVRGLEWVMVVIEDDVGVG
jgi:hypothetical protein